MANRAPPMLTVAARMPSRARRNVASSANSPLPSKQATRSPTLTQPDSVVAMAMPVPPTAMNSAKLSTTFNAMEIAANTMGLLVSSRAKKLGCRTLIST